MEAEAPFAPAQPNSLFTNNKEQRQPPNLNFYSIQFAGHLASDAVEKKIQKHHSFNTCANKLCKNHSQANKHQPLEVSQETLCYRCRQQFQKDSYCIYCKQIYFDETDDGKQWIMCEQCSRWVHTQCADFNTKENPNAVFQCIKCKKIDTQPYGRRNIPRAGYAKLEKKKNNQFLTSIGFDWELTTNEISEDMENIRKCLG